MIPHPARRPLMFAAFVVVAGVWCGLALMGMAALAIVLSCCALIDWARHA